MLKYPTLRAALDELKKIGLDSTFRSFWEGRFPGSFYVLRHEPRWFFHKSRVGPDMRVARCVPLIEDGDCEFAYDPEIGDFVVYYYEYGGSGPYDCVTIGKTYQQMLSWMLFELADAGLWEVVEEVAPHFGYRYLAELDALFQSHWSESYLHVKRRFVESTP